MAHMITPTSKVTVSLPTTLRLDVGKYFWRSGGEKCFSLPDQNLSRVCPSRDCRDQHDH
jgi:hypothetical protein